MGVFWKWRSRRPARAAAAWSRLAQRIYQYQVRVAALLQVQLHKLSVTVQTVIVMGICIMFTIVSIYLFYKGANRAFWGEHSVQLPPAAINTIDSLIK